MDNKNHDLNGVMVLGGRRLGIGIFYKEGSKYLFGGNVKNPIFKIRLPKKKKTHKVAERRKKSFGKQWNRIRPFQITAIIKQIWHTISWEKLKLTGEFGLANPMNTGILYGSLMGILNLLKNANHQVDLTPNFTKNVTNLKCDVVIKFRPAILAWQVGTVYWRRKLNY